MFALTKRCALMALLVAQTALPAETLPTAFAAPLRVHVGIGARRNVGVCRCVPDSGLAHKAGMSHEEKEVDKTIDLVMSLDSGAEMPADENEDSVVEARLLATRKGFEEEREKKTEEKKDLYLQSLDGNFQRKTTHNYLSWIQADMESQESRRHRDDDFGETDDEAGGVREDGYVKKSPSKNSFTFFKTMPETLVSKATDSKTDVLTWWDKLFGRRAVRKMRDSTWLDGLK